METIIVAALQAGALIVVALFGLYGARKLGIGQNQEKLVSTLKGLIDAQNLKIEELEKRDTEKGQRIEKLEARVAELTELNINQALEIQRLTRSERRTTRAQADKGGE